MKIKWFYFLVGICKFMLYIFIYIFNNFWCIKFYFFVEKILKFDFFDISIRKEIYDFVNYFFGYRLWKEWDSRISRYDYNLKEI